MAHYDNDILEHYKLVAEEQKLDQSSTMKDLRTRMLETELILTFVNEALRKRKLKGNKNDAIIIGDIGCGNGYTLQVLKEHLAEFDFNVKLFGFEYSPELRALAHSRFPDDSVKILPIDIRNKQNFPDVKLDIAICQRVFINLLDHADQALARDNVISLLKPGADFLSIEAYESTLKVLNEARKEFNIGSIPPAPHNLYLKDDFFKVFDLKKFESDTVSIPSNFLSSHYYVSRVLSPILMGSREFIRNSHFTNFMSQAINQNIGDFSPVKAFAFTKTI